MNKLFLSATVCLCLISSVFASGNKNSGTRVHGYILPVGDFSNYMQKSADTLQMDFAGIATSETIEADALPKTVKKNIAAKYGDYQLVQALKIKLNNETVYLISIEKDGEPAMIKVSE